MVCRAMLNQHGVPREVEYSATNYFGNEGGEAAFYVSATLLLSALGRWMQLSSRISHTIRRNFSSHSENDSSAHRFLHERSDPASLAAVQLRQRERGRPHDAFVEVRLVAGAECRVPRLELLRALKEADDVPCP